jgi:hypothetical protein
MKHILCISLLLLLGGTSYAASYEVKEVRNSLVQRIIGANGEGLTVVSSPKPVHAISANFSCSMKGEDCLLALQISYDSVVDHSGQPVEIMVDGVIKDSFKGLVTIAGTTSQEILLFSSAESIEKLHAISNFRILIGNTNTRTEVVLDTSQFNLSRIK